MTLDPRLETRREVPMDPMALMIAWFIMIFSTERWWVAVLSTLAFMVLSTLPMAR